MWRENAGDLNPSKAQRIELRDPPSQALWHGGAQGPEQPVGPGMQEQAELIGGRLLQDVRSADL